MTSNVVPFPIRAQRGLLADLRRQASAARDPDLIERCLRAAVRRHGEILADKGIDSDLVKAEMRSMEWLLLGSVSDDRNGKKKAKKKRFG